MAEVKDFGIQTIVDHAGRGYIFSYANVKDYTVFDDRILMEIDAKESDLLAAAFNPPHNPPLTNQRMVLRMIKAGGNFNFQFSFDGGVNFRNAPVRNQLCHIFYKKLLEKYKKGGSFSPFEIDSLISLVGYDAIHTGMAIGMNVLTGHPDQNFDRDVLPGNFLEAGVLGVGAARVALSNILNNRNVDTNGITPNGRVFLKKFNGLYIFSYDAGAANQTILSKGKFHFFNGRGRVGESAIDQGAFDKFVKFKEAVKRYKDENQNDTELGWIEEGITKEEEELKKKMSNVAYDSARNRFTFDVSDGSTVPATIHHMNLPLNEENFGLFENLIYTHLIPKALESNQNANTIDTFSKHPFNPAMARKAIDERFEEMQKSEMELRKIQERLSLEEFIKNNGVQGERADILRNPASPADKELVYEIQHLRDGADKINPYLESLFYKNTDSYFDFFPPAGSSDSTATKAGFVFGLLTGGLLAKKTIYDNTMNDICSGWHAIQPSVTTTRNNGIFVKDQARSNILKCCALLLATDGHFEKGQKHSDLFGKIVDKSGFTPERIMQLLTKTENGDCFLYNEEKDRNNRTLLEIAIIGCFKAETPPLIENRLYPLHPFKGRDVYTSSGCDFMCKVKDIFMKTQSKRRSICDGIVLSNDRSALFIDDDGYSDLEARAKHAGNSAVGRQVREQAILSKLSDRVQSKQRAVHSFVDQYRKQGSEAALSLLPK
jgi:hypothetical protein